MECIFKDADVTREDLKSPVILNILNILCFNIRSVGENFGDFLILFEILSFRVKNAFMESVDIHHFQFAENNTVEVFYLSYLKYLNIKI